LPYVAFGLRVKRSAANLSVRGAGCNQWRLTVSCCSSKHAADPSLTDEDGKQDAKEDNDDEDELHVLEPCIEC
jgi:hypothetical protein